MGADPERRRRATAASRLLYTLVAPLAVWLMQRVPLPGLDVGRLHEFVDGFSETVPATMSVGALGIVPYVAAAGLVELAALGVAGWRPLRETEDGRQKLSQATLWLGLLIAAFQAYGIVQFALSLDGDAGLVDSAPIFGASLIAGFCLTLVVVAVVSARGAINGVVAVWLSGWLLGFGDHLALMAQASEASAVSPTHALTLTAATMAVVAVATIGVERSAVVAGGESEGGGGPYRSRVRRLAYVAIPAPACGVIAAQHGIAMPQLTATLARLGLLDDPSWSASSALVYVVGALAAVIFTMLFHRLERLAASWDSSDDELRRARWQALPAAIAFTLLLLAVGDVADNRAIVVVVAVLAMAALDGWRHLTAPGAMQPVRAYHRAFEAEAAAARLEAAGLDVHLKDLHSRTLLHFFGPFVPISLMVPAADVEAAREALDADDAPPARPRATRWWAPVVVCALALGALLGVDRGLEAAFALPPVPEGPPVTLEVMTVADDSPWMETVAQAEDVPAGVTFAIENAPLGPGDSAPRYYARTSGDEPRPEVEAWLAARMPPGHRLHWQRVFDFDEATGQLTAVGWRSFLLHDQVWLDGSHVLEATARRDESDIGPAWYVLVTLTTEGDAIFTRLTEENVKRRIAMVVDGRVDSAPEVREPIAGGTVRITMGAGDPIQQRDDARRLAAALSRGAK